MTVRAEVAGIAQGELDLAIAAKDWAANPLGSPDTWPVSLTTAFRMALRSSALCAVYWGPEFRLLYNGASSSVIGDEHPAALGVPASDLARHLGPAWGYDE